ncbi:hypothetical protein [Synoicihabitans lomoniglobus]|uniref:Uncharacterized protein n=1 Tax=Synoicihabitans lomoniglobus TaxID=2909285 RepID=A0AAE9ZS43_9BACT|nr:hypothetical protein [Opitutaceae bacterium LMO-M01]WED63226.1 hypothetical protein PXH66_12890 [Opitutaceae bacterium LMO-M01]
MITPRSPSDFVWIPALVAALIFGFWAADRRVDRLDAVAAQTRGEAVIDGTSPTGYRGAVRDRVVSDVSGRSFEWIAQTQRAMADGRWRLRAVPDENAPFGRETHVAAPYRWWLEIVAHGEHSLSGMPEGLAVERAALIADPWLGGIFLVMAVGLVARVWGGGAAVWMALGGATMFPLAAAYPPGVPDDHGLFAIFALLSVCALGAGVARADSRSPTAAMRWFAVAGVGGGIALWIRPADQVPVCLGIGLGALLVAWSRRGAYAARPVLLPWRGWALGGGAMVLLGSMVEYFPDQLDTWELRAVHPLYGLSWIGAGEVLARLTRWIQRGERPQGFGGVGLSALGLSASLAVPVTMWLAENPGFLATESLAFRLTKEPTGVFAPSLGAWLQAEGMTFATMATLVPLVVWIPVGWIVGRRRGSIEHVSQLALLAGVLVPLVGLAWPQLRWWMLVDGVSLFGMAVLWAMVSEKRLPRARRGIAATAGGIVLLVGAVQTATTVPAADEVTLNLTEAESVLERDLAHWMATQTDGKAIVLAPPVLTTALSYYGGLQGVASNSWENTEGLLAAIRIVISTSRHESLALLESRGVTHLVLPSWDPFFSQYLADASVQVGDMFYPTLDRWILPTWLKPVAYVAPKIPGLEGYHVRVLELVDEQTEPAAASRLTAYFIEMGQLENADLSRQLLLKYPADFSALVALAELEAALGKAEAFAEIFQRVVDRLQGGADRSLSWDRRVSLAVLLARGNRMDLAEKQARWCLDRVNEKRLRALSNHGLFYYLALNDALGLTMEDDALRGLAVELLPVALRDAE